MLLDKFQGLEYSFIVIDEVADMPNWNGPDLRDSEERLFAELLRRGLLSREEINPREIIRQTPTYTRRELEPLPEFFCLHFIGGPKSGTEEFWPYKKNYDLIQQGKPFTIAMQSPLPPIIAESGEITTHQFESYTYKPTFIPRSETPFSDAQVVVCIFQG